MAIAQSAVIIILWIGNFNNFHFIRLLQQYSKESIILCTHKYYFFYDNDILYTFMFNYDVAIGSLLYKHKMLFVYDFLANTLSYFTTQI